MSDQHEHEERPCGAQGNLAAAKQEFHSAAKLRSNGRINIAGHLALANLLFRQARSRGRHAAAREVLGGPGVQGQAPGARLSL